MDDAIASLPPLRDIIRDHDLRAEKKLGQNFLLDLNLTDKIVAAAGDLSGVHVFEIGPGPGGLTRSLLRTKALKVTAVEYDPRAIKALESLKQAASDRLEILHQDALNIDLCSLSKAPRAIVANLPYNIATPLLINWLKQIDQNHTSYQSMTLMFQKEVGQRITAADNIKSYGRLGILSQWLCDVQIKFDVPASAFMPPPKVVSSIVKLIPKKRLGDQPSFQQLEKLTAAAFGQRRKMIRSSLKEYHQYFDACGLEETIRAENMRVEDFINLARASGRN
jgi:16S rRNA (adenine1518-N6/adenine1519-N6)-dimethyltransferase